MKEENRLGNFLGYPSEIQQYREKFMNPKTLNELLLVNKEQIQAEFQVKKFSMKVLSYAQIDEAAFHLGNKKMNRYPNILAYEHSRIKFQDNPQFYLNANEVNSFLDGKTFAVFGQAPLPPFDNFWETIYQKSYNHIFMLCSLVDPRKGKQADRYWPEKDKPNFLKQVSLQVEVLEQNIIFQDELVQRLLLIKGSRGDKRVHHYKLLNWYDHKKPLENKLESLEYLIKLGLKLIEEKEQIFIHCSAGVGRSGTFGGILEGIRMYERDRSLSIFAIVENLRKYRYHAVQTFQQYNFLYTYLKNRIQEIK